MILYHENKKIVEYPGIRRGRFNSDFYFGFYCTNSEKQAKRWAMRYGEKGYINKYEYTENKKLKILRFAEMTEEWLDFIAACRNGQAHQISFHTISALDTLRFTGAITNEYFII